MRTFYSQKLKGNLWAFLPSFHQKVWLCSPSELDAKRLLLKEKKNKPSMPLSCSWLQTAAPGWSQTWSHIFCTATEEDMNFFLEYHIWNDKLSYLYRWLEVNPYCASLLRGRGEGRRLLEKQRELYAYVEEGNGCMLHVLSAFQSGLSIQAVAA